MQEGWNVIIDTFREIHFCLDPLPSTVRSEVKFSKSTAPMDLAQSTAFFMGTRQIILDHNILIYNIPLFAD